MSLVNGVISRVFSLAEEAYRGCLQMVADNVVATGWFPGGSALADPFDLYFG